MPLLQNAAARMAEGAGFDLDMPGGRPASPGDPGRLVHGPVAAPVSKVDRQPGGVRVIAPAAAPRGPGQMRRSRPVTGLARDIDLRPGRLESIALRAVVLAQVGGVAFGAHVVPVLIDPGPMKRISRLQVPPRIEVEPATSAVFARPAVPGDAERLQAAAG